MPGDAGDRGHPPADLARQVGAREDQEVVVLPARRAERRELLAPDLQAQQTGAFLEPLRCKDHPRPLLSMSERAASRVARRVRRHGCDYRGRACHSALDRTGRQDIAWDYEIVEVSRVAVEAVDLLGRVGLLRVQ